jgi:hypothetical protein
MNLQQYGELMGNKKKITIEFDPNIINMVTNPSALAMRLGQQVLAQLVAEAPKEEPKVELKVEKKVKKDDKYEDRGQGNDLVDEPEQD